MGFPQFAQAQTVEQSGYQWFANADAADVGSVIGTGWHNASWAYRKKITIDRTKVSQTAQANFPVLISRTDADWKDTANGGKVAQSDGGDILFTDAGGTTKLDHEIEKYTPSTGELIAWVRVPALYATQDTVLFTMETAAWRINGIQPGSGPTGMLACGI